MNYSGASPIVGVGQASAEAVDAWFAARGPAAARDYAPDGRYAPPPGGLGDACVAFGKQWGLNSDLIAAQCAHESAFWQSRYARERNNPAGLGAVNDDPDQALTFSSVDAGIGAQAAHLADYAIGRGAWTASDPRAAAMPDDWFGSAPTLAGLNGKWASPGATYGQQIAAAANDLLAFANDGAWNVTTGDDARFAWVPDPSEFGYPDGAHGRAGQPVELLILHITAGTDSLAWLRDGHGNSTHYLTDTTGRPRAQLVREADAAWAAGNRAYNLRAINVEVEMTRVADWTDAILRETARTIAPILKRNNIPAVYLGRDNGPGKRGLVGHRDVPDGSGGWGGSSHHDDPGAAFDWPTFIGYLKAEIGTSGGEHTHPPAPSVPDDQLPPALPECVRDPWSSPLAPGTWIPRVFVEAINEAGWPRAGYALTEARARGNQIVQWFERARLELNHDGSVTWGRVGAEALAAERAREARA